MVKKPNHSKNSVLTKFFTTHRALKGEFLLHVNQFDTAEQAEVDFTFRTTIIPTTNRLATSITRSAQINIKHSLAKSLVPK